MTCHQDAPLLGGLILTFGSGFNKQEGYKNSWFENTQTESKHAHSHAPTTHHRWQNFALHFTTPVISKQVKILLSFYLAQLKLGNTAALRRHTAEAEASATSRPSSTSLPPSAIYRVL